MKEALIRNKWIEFSTTSGFSLTFEPWSYFDERPLLHIKLPIWFNLFIHLPFKTGKEECETPKFGIYWFEQALWFCFGRKIKVWHMPWSWDFYKRWERISGYEKDSFHWIEIPISAPNGKVGEKETHKYKYILKNGSIQNREAEIYVDKMQWRWRMFKFIPFIHKTQVCININFDKEIGEKTGSWKGGCVGCSYEMKSGESALQALRRMEKERKF